MKIVFLSESFFPFSYGGSEWSMYYLAKDLVQVGHKIIILTPNLGAKRRESLNGIEIIRFPFYIKHKSKHGGPENFVYSNPVWIIWSAVQIYLCVRKEDIDIIHVHGKYSIASARIANIFLRKKLLATMRDYQLICNYGFCLYDKNKSCNLLEYYKYDLLFYWSNYIENKSLFTFILNLCFAVIGRLNINIHKMFVKSVPTIALSNKQREILAANSFNTVGVIGNSINFPKTLLKLKKQKKIVYAGRLTPGKGIDLLIAIIPTLFALFPDYQFLIIGEGFLKASLLSLSKKYKGLKIMGTVNHNKLLQFFRRSVVVIVPSVWPEPFGRVALESLSSGTPVVASNVGGLPEIVKDKKFGYIARPTPKDILFALESAIRNNDTLQKNIRKNYSLLKKEFSTDIYQKYLNVYKKL